MCSTTLLSINPLRNKQCPNVDPTDPLTRLVVTHQGEKRLEHIRLFLITRFDRVQVA